MISLLLLAATWVQPAPIAQEAQEPAGPSAIVVLEKAQQAAKASGRTLFVYLEAPW